MFLLLFGVSIPSRRFRNLHANPPAQDAGFRGERFVRPLSIRFCASLAPPQTLPRAKNANTFALTLAYAYLCPRINILRYMLFLSMFLLALTAIVADFIHFRRNRHRHVPRRKALIAWAAATDALPLVSSVINVLSPDNGTGLMYLYMWLFWGWIVTVLPRLAFYVFNFLHLRRTGYAVAAGLTLFFLWGATWGRTSIRVSEVEICSDRIPEAFDGYRFVQISDIHVGTIVRPEHDLARLAECINSLHPDAVFFTGDLVNIRAEELDDRTRPLLRQIEGPVWSVTGNHDVGTYIKDSVRFPAAVQAREVVARQRSMGWRVLEDTTVYLRRGADSISLTGISFDPALRDRRHDRNLPAPALGRAYAGVPDSLFNITLVHLPQLWGQILETGHGDLTLSGHVHSMQFKIRPWGRGWSPASWIYEHWSGRYDADGRTLYVNDGTGYVAYPMRLGAWPEVTLFTLKRCE